MRATRISVGSRIFDFGPDHSVRGGMHMRDVPFISDLIDVFLLDR